MNSNLINFLIRLKNASLAKKDNVKIKKLQAFDIYASILYKEGFIQSYSIEKAPNEDQKYITVNLRSFQDKSLLENLKPLSLPSKRKIISYLQLSQMNLRNKLVILSTSKGILPHTECLKLKLGGVVLFSC